MPSTYKRGEERLVSKSYFVISIIYQVKYFCSDAKSIFCRVTIASCDIDVLLLIDHESCAHHSTHLLCPPQSQQCLHHNHHTRVSPCPHLSPYQHVMSMKVFFEKRFSYLLQNMSYTVSFSFCEKPSFS